jgi:hypothetical protein
MTRTRRAGLCLMAVLAGCALAAASASAEPPEFGRCLKLTGEQAMHGGFTNASCTMPSAMKTGKYEWLPGAAKAKFTTKSAPGKKIDFDGVGGVRVSCATETSSGEFTTPKLEENVVFKFNGCETGEMHLPVTTPGAEPGEVLTDPIECELGVLEKGATPRNDKIGMTCGLGEPGIDVPAFMVMKWGKTGGYSFELEWTFRGWWFFTVKSNRMTTTYNLHSRENHGMQYWSKFVEGPPEPLEASFDEGKTWELAGLSLSTVQTDEEPIEINSVA